MKYFLSSLILFFLIGFTSLAHAETRVCFSPNGSCQEAVIAEIDKAHQSIDIAMYEFTSKAIAQALVEAKDRKVKVRIVLNRAQIKDHNSKGRYLVGKGFVVKYNLGPGLMHNKFAVIDGQVVLTGSYNWTVVAEKKNAENLLILSDQDIAGKYAKQFKHLWSQAGEGQSKGE